MSAFLASSFSSSTLISIEAATNAFSSTGKSVYSCGFHLNL
ncbi:hypothetical protein [Clostridioides difficile]|nr:hypothetical protein [Clostridioides difficile]